MKNLLFIFSLLLVSIGYSQLGDKSANQLVIEGSLKGGEEKFTEITVLDLNTGNSYNVKAKKNYLLVIPCSKDYEVTFNNGTVSKKLNVSTSSYIAKPYFKYLDIEWSSKVEEITCMYRKGNYRFSFPKTS